MLGPSNKAMYSYENGVFFYADGKGNITTGNSYLEGDFFDVFWNDFSYVASNHRHQWTYELPLELLL